MTWNHLRFFKEANDIIEFTCYSGVSGGVADISKGAPVGNTEMMRQMQYFLLLLLYMNSSQRAVFLL